MTPKKCMSIAKSLTNTQHMELEPLCSVSSPLFCSILLGARMYNKKKGDDSENSRTGFITLFIDGTSFYYAF